jgi:hypothetical protein
MMGCTPTTADVKERIVLVSCDDDMLLVLVTDNQRIGILR